MKIHKPDDLALLYRVLRWQGRDVLSIGAIAGFRLTGPANAPLLSEAEIWQRAAIACPDTPLDEGVPKPAGEFLLVGTAYAPDGQPVPHLPVSVRVGDVSKQLYVFGDRQATALGGLSAPAPFVTMSLAGTGISIPNVEDPGHRVVSPADAPPRAGFGPVPTDDTERAMHLGPFDARWHAREWPHFPASTSAEYAHMARPDQRNTGYWRGDEAIELIHLTAGQAMSNSALPALRARCFVRRQGEVSMRLEEAAAQADTVWLLPDLDCGLVLYRGVVALSDEDGDDVLDVVAGWEAMATAPRAAADYEAIVFPPAVEVTPAPVPAAAAIPAVHTPPSPDAAPHAAADTTLPGLHAAEASVAALERDTEDMLRHAGLTRADVEKALPRTEPEPAMDLPALTRLVDDLERQAQSSADAHGVTPAMIAALLAASQPTAPAQSMVETLAQLESDVAAMQASLGMTPELLDDLIARHPEAAVLREPPPEPLQALKLPAIAQEAAAARKEAAAPPPQSPQSTPDLSEVKRHTRETVIAAHAEGHRLAGMDLSGLDLGGVSLTGADLSDANLSGTRFDGTDLTGASLRNARCAGARFANARLGGAQLDHGDFTGADLTSAVMEGARCTGALFDGAVMTSLRAAGCNAAGASFADAGLTDADFARANLQAARFQGTQLGGASLIGAQCEKSEWYGANAEGCRLTEALLERSRADAKTILRGADLSGARLDDANWEGVDLRGAVMQRARLDGADFSRVQGDGARLSQASARGTRFDKASLVDADLTLVNLFGGSLRRARVSGATLRGANLYGADAYGADFSGARLDGATTTRTVLATPGRPESITARTVA